MLTLLTQLIVGIIALILLIDIFTGFKICKSIFNRAQKKVDTIAEEIRDPEADAHVALRDIETKKTEMVELRKQILMAKKKAESNKSRSIKEVDRYEELAKLAGSSGNTEDVKLALSKKSVAQKKVSDAENEISRLTTQEDSLETKINEFDVLIENAKSNKDYLTSQLKINQFNTSVNEVLKDGGKAMSALERLEADVENSRIEAEISGELSQEAAGLEAKYKTPSGISDDEVAKYLKK